MIAGVKKRKTDGGGMRSADSHLDWVAAALVPLLEVVVQKGLYHPTEDSDGTHAAFLRRIATLTLTTFETAGA